MSTVTTTGTTVWVPVKSAGGWTMISVALTDCTVAVLPPMVTDAVLLNPLL